MGILVIGGATLKCSFGVAPSNLMVLPVNKVNVLLAAANIMDNKPLVNILPFGMCSSMSNPTVASATSAALGVLTPMPCTPLTTAPWSSGAAKVKIGNMPALTKESTLMCQWGGMIQIVSPGQTKINCS